MAIKIGIIGFGKMGKHHARVIQQCPDALLYALADIEQEVASDFFSHDIIISKDYHDWIDRVDAVIIATPTSTHYNIAMDCLSRSVHVLLEKPMASTYQEAESLFNYAKEKNKILQIGHVERFNPAFTVVRSLMQSNNPCFIENKRNNVALPRLLYDSVLLDLMIHDIDLVLQCINVPIKSMQVFGSFFDTARAEFFFENGSNAVFYASRVASFSERTMLVRQNKDEIEIDFSTQSIKRSSDKNVEQPLRKNPLLEQLIYFINRIQIKKYQNNVDHELHVLKTTFTLEKSLV
jgi:predicted dehydrogenase